MYEYEGVNGDYSAYAEYNTDALARGAPPLASRPVASLQCIADPVAASDSANQLVPTADVHSILAPGQQQEYVPLHRTVTQDRAQAGSVTADC